LPSALAPVFVFAVHRSGSTLLGRVLNAHPQLVIWGEHGGILNSLADMDLMITRTGPADAPRAPAWLARYAAEPEFRTAEFEPWTTPGRLGGMRDAARMLIKNLFAQDAAADQRWGFKEIRYNRPHVAAYLAALFPGAQFILLQRDLVEAAVSNILVGWSLDPLKFPDDWLTPVVLDAIVTDVLYALLAINEGFRQIEAALGANCFTLNYETLARRRFGDLLHMFSFLNLDVSPVLMDRLDGVLSVRAFETDKAARFGGALSEDSIRARAEVLLPALRAEIAADGVDRPRLLSRKGWGGSASWQATT
jgi:hypothetical protein